MPHRALDRLLAGVASLAVLALTGCLTITGPVAGPPGEGVEISETAAPSPPGEELADDSEEVAGPEEGEGAREDEDAEQDAQDGGESAPGWADVTARTSSGIVRLTAIGCDPEMRGTGSGFLIAPDLVVTAAHVVEGAMSTSVAVDGEVRDAVALGVDLDADVALLMLDAPVERGHLFEWPEFEVLPGSDVAALGFPLGGDLSITSGTLSAYEREGGREWVRISAPVNPGNSGGPVVDRTGEVVGIVSHRITESGGRQVDGVGYALSHVTARPLVEKWRGSPEHPASPECATGTGSPAFPVDGDVSEPDVAVAALTVVAHGEAINHGSYESAFALFTPRMQQAMGGLEGWASGLRSSYWTELTLRDSAVLQDGVALRMTLRTEQSPENGPDGLTCSDWDLTYTLLWDGEAQEFLIDEVRLESDPVGCA